MNTTLRTGAGDTLSDTCKQAKRMTDRFEIVDFEFNGIKVFVDETTNLDWLSRDYSTAWIMDWKEIGPKCVETYPIELQQEIDKRRAEKELKAENRRKEIEAADKIERDACEALVKDIVLEINHGMEEEYKAYVEKNSHDGYSRGVVDYAEFWAKLMQIEIAKGHSVKDIADSSQEGLNFLGITGFMYGCAVQALARFWKHGEELRKWHNKEYGVSEDKEGVVNPAILTINI